MGEATYYMKARFKDAETLNKVYPQIKDFIIELQLADKFIDDNEISTEVKILLADKRIRTNFPVVYDYLKNCKRKYADLDFGQPYDIDSLVHEEDILYYDAEVSHMTSWSDFVEYLKTRFGAVNSAWISDDNIDPYDVINV